MSDRVGRSIALCANAADVLPALVARGITPDVVTDQTSAHDALNGYIPNGLALADAERLRDRQPDEYIARSMSAMADHVRAMLALKQRGAVVFDYGNNIRAQARLAGVANAFDIPGFVPEYIRPLFCEGKGPFRWAALSGDPEDIRITDEAALEMFAHDESLVRWIHLAQARVAFQGLPARILWLGYGERRAFWVAYSIELVREGAAGRRRSSSAAITFDTGSVASPNRETEGMMDGSDAIADWPVLNALLNTASGATWVSMHHGGGVGIGYSLHAGMVIVAERDDATRTKSSMRGIDSYDPGIGRDQTRRRGLRCGDQPRPSAKGCAYRCVRRTGMLTCALPASARRVAAAFEASPSRIPVLIGGCGSGRTTLLQQLRERGGRTSVQYIDVERTATTPERFLRAISAVSPFPVTDTSPAGARAAFDATMAFFGRAATSSQRAGDLPARRVPRRCGRSRKLPRPAARCSTTSSTASPPAATVSS